jgi:ribosomal protein S18 acetylase RimI-like enzyme
MADTVRVRRLEPDDWERYRDVRLESLADAPYAYGSTLAREQEFGEATWRSRLTGETGVSVIASSDTETVGLMGVYTGLGFAMLVAAWVRPTARGLGVADALIADVLDWSRSQGYAELELRVADGNNAARNLFLRNGFQATGEREPLESDPTVDTERMIYKL